MRDKDSAREWKTADAKLTQTHTHWSLKCACFLSICFGCFTQPNDLWVFYKQTHFDQIIGSNLFEFVFHTSGVPQMYSNVSPERASACLCSIAFTHVQIDKTMKETRNPFAPFCRSAIFKIVQFLIAHLSVAYISIPNCRLFSVSLSLFCFR